jgi:hypothetical protein
VREPEAEATSDAEVQPIGQNVRPPSPYRRAVVGVIIGGVCIVYLLSSLTYGRTLRSAPAPSGFQGYTADAIIHWRSYIGIAPTGLTDLEDPYDPVANAQFRGQGLHDYVLFNGKIYSSTGPTPAVLANIPYRLLGFGYLNPNLATLGFCTVGFLAAVGCYFECRRRFYRASPLWLDAAAVVSLGLGTPVPWLISIGRTYEAAIACGYTLTALSAYLLLRALRNLERPNFVVAALAGGTAAAAVGARPPLAVLVFFVIAAGYAVSTHVINRRKRIQVLVALAVPYMALGLLLALYNRARFGSVTEFGTKYQLAGYNMPKYPAYRVGYVWPNVRDYLFAFPRFEAKWPYVHLKLSSVIGPVSPHTNEPVAGALWLFPSIVVGLAMLTAARRRVAEQMRGLIGIVVLAAAVSLMVVLAVSLPFNSSTMRYAIDFTPLLVIAGTIGAAAAVATAAGSSRRVVLGTLWMTAAGVSALVGIALVLTRCPGTGSC